LKYRLKGRSLTLHGSLTRVLHDWKAWTKDEAGYGSRRGPQRAVAGRGTGCRAVATGGQVGTDGWNMSAVTHIAAAPARPAGLSLRHAISALSAVASREVVRFVHQRG